MTFKTLHFPDEDECKQGKDNCPDHSACVNTFGSFMCICCNGYEDDGNGICVGEVLM